MFGQELAEARRKLAVWEVYARRAKYAVRMAEWDLFEARRRARLTERHGQEISRKIRGQIRAAENVLEYRKVRAAEFRLGRDARALDVERSGVRYRAAYLREFTI